MSPQGLRERKKAETRLAISRAALRLAVDNGLNAVTGEAIAAAANVSERTFRNYFQGKEDALTFALDDCERQIVDALHEHPDDESVVDALEAAVLSTLANSGAEFDTWIAASHLLAMNPALQGHFAAGQDHGKTALVAEIARRAGVDPVSALYPRLVAHTLTALLRSVFQMQGSLSLTRDQVLDKVREAYELLRNGLAAPA